MRRSPRLGVSFALILLTLGRSLIASGAQAQTLEDRLRSQLVAVTTQLRDAQSGQAALTARADAAEKARDALKAKLATTQAQLSKAKQAESPATPSPELEQYRAKTQNLEQADAQDKSDLTAARADASRLTDQVAQLQAEHDRSAAALAVGAASLSTCKSKNAEAIKVAKDVLRAYDRVSVADVLARKEPFTGLKRVRIEQIEQDYGDRLYDSRLDVPPRKPADPAKGSPTPANGAGSPK